MLIPYFECKGHHQFSLPGIVRIEAEFGSSVQIIIGTNGAGKTTLLREINPLPALSSDYAPGGYKRIVILDKGNRYYLASEFSKPVKHIFELNGENLNVSGKETEQRKLVRDHFGITPQLMKLVTGEILFSNLSTQARRDWLMSISGMNFEYGMELFQRIRDFNREAQTLAKSMTGREADELEKLAQIGDISVMKERSVELSRVITQLMRLQTNDKLRSVNEIKSTVQYKLEKIKTDSHHLIYRLPRKLVYRFEDIGSIEELKVHAQSLANGNDRYKEELSELYRKKEDLVRLAERTRDEGISLQDESAAVLELKAHIETLTNSEGLACPLFLDDDILSESIDEFFTKFRLTVEGYVDNTRLTYNSERYKELQALEAEITQTMRTIRSEYDGVLHAIKHQNDMPDADCPDCGKHFKIGNADRKIKELREDEIRLSDKLSIQEDRHSSVKEELGRFMEFFGARKDIFLTLDSNSAPAIKTLKQMIEEKERLGIGSRGLQEIIHDWYEVVRLSREVVKMKKEVERREFALKHLMEVEELRKHYEGTQLDDVDVEIDRLMVMIERANAEINDAKKLVTETTHVLNKFNELLKLKESIGEDLKDFTKYHEQTLISETLLALQTELAGIQTTISKVDSIQHTVNNLARYREEYERDSSASRKLMEMISPNTGLIAEHVLGFLEDFTEEINRLVAQVWEYEMEILPCKLDGDMIDYRFPVRVSNDDRIRKDIVETSKGQLAFINLIFRLIIMSSVDKTILPLYLDEPTEGFDEQHCENFVRFVKGYLEQGATEQIFMISHDFAGHASFTLAETMVLDEKNVLNKPPRYNQHVKFSYV